MNYEILIIHNDSKKGKTAYSPAVIEPVTWKQKFRGKPSELKFKVVRKWWSVFTEGDLVIFRVNGKNVFLGFIFKKSRDKKHQVEVTAYDQMRYLLNKDTMYFESMTASEIIKHIVKAHPSMQLGSINDTKIKLKSRLEDNNTYLDMITTALDETLIAGGNMCVLYDDYGKLTLKGIHQMVIDDFIIDEDNVGDMDYKTSIDKDVYSQVKLIHEDKDTKKREVYISKSSWNINRWGLLQLTEKIENTANAKARADSLLKLHSKKLSTLSLKDVKGNINVRAGSMVMVDLHLGDEKVAHYMLVDDVTHKFKESHYTMDMKVRGGVING